MGRTSGTEQKPNTVKDKIKGGKKRRETRKKWKRRRRKENKIRVGVRVRYTFQQ